MAFQTITFDEFRWASAVGITLPTPTGGNTFDDSPSASNPLGTGAKFIIALGTMDIENFSGNRILGFFAPVAGGMTSTGRLVIQFAAPQKFVRFFLTSDFGGAFDASGSIIPVLVQFRAVIGDAASQVGPGQSFTFGDLPTTVEFLNATQGIREIVITTRSTENILDNLQFSDSALLAQRDVAVAFDGSGSMSVGGKFGAMIEAGDIFRDLYAALGDPFDTFGGLLFRWNCAMAVGGSLNAQRPSPGPLSSAVDIPSVFASESPQGCTPIGQAMLDCAGMVNSGANPGKSILLLTDGINNEGISVPAASTDPSLAGVTVHCVGLGSGAAINPIEITSLAMDHGGIYRETTAPSEILDFFAQALSQILGKAELAVVTGDSAVVATGTTKAVFLLAWGVGGPALNFNLQAPDGSVFNAPFPVPAGLVSFIRFFPGNASSFHSYYVVEGADLGGTWMFVGAPPAARRVVVEDLRLRIRWSIAPKLGLTGAPIVIRAEITDRGRPYRGQAEIRARVTRPDQSIGDLLAVGGASLARRPGGVDANIRAAVAARGMELKKLDELPLVTRNVSSRRSASPGVYEIEYADTDLDGVYRFDLEIQSLAGKPLFHRRITLFSVLVSEPSPNVSTATLTPSAPGLWQLQVALLTKAKRSAGPFLGSVLRLHSGPGKMIGPLKDNLDGSYSQLLAWDGKGPANIYFELLGRKFSLGKPKVGKPKIAKRKIGKAKIGKAKKS